MPPTANSPSLFVSSEKGFTGEQSSRLTELFIIPLQGYPAGKATLIPAWEGKPKHCLLHQPHSQVFLPPVPFSFLRRIKDTSWTPRPSRLSPQSPPVPLNMAPCNGHTNPDAPTGACAPPQLPALPKITALVLAAPASGTGS